MPQPSGAIGLLRKAHAQGILPSRFGRLVELIDEAAPRETVSVLDVGAGSGTIARRLQDRHPAWRVKGVDVLLRPDPDIPIQPFDGQRLPFTDGAFDIVMLIDVLHHTTDPKALLAECVRVASSRVIIKDHSQQGRFDRMLLRGMDWVGNASYGVALPGRYFNDQEWTTLYQGLPVEVLERKPVAIYPFPFSTMMPRHLQTFYVLRPLLRKRSSI